MWAADCQLDAGVLHVESMRALSSPKSLQSLLEDCGPKIIGIDTPFGQHKAVYEAFGAATWPELIGMFDSMQLDEITQRMRKTKDTTGNRKSQHHRRKTDWESKAAAANNTNFPPVGAMCALVMPIVLRSGCDAPPVHRTSSDTVAIEAYPKLVAQALLGAQKYKRRAKSKVTEHECRASRRLLISELSKDNLNMYGVRLDLSKLSENHCEDLVSDPYADGLDSILAGIQAAWSYSQRDNNWGIPVDASPLEGWIVDPSLLH